VTGDKKYIAIPENGRIYELVKGSDDLWRDISGCVWALHDGVTADPVERCGVAPFALPDWPIFVKINDACKPHDYAFTSPAYQAFHTFGDANVYLQGLQTAQGCPVLGEAFEEISDEFGAKYWENKKTLTSELSEPPLISVD
jgi:hypothetical protein